MSHFETSWLLAKHFFYLQSKMESPFQGPGGGQAHLPHQTSYPGSQGLIMAPNATMMPAEIPEGQAEMETTSGMTQVGLSNNPQTQKDISISMICRMGQETVQDIITKTSELFSLLKSLQPKSPRLPDLRYFIKAESFSVDVTNTEETLRKCRTVLKIRKKCNLKYKDIILPDEYIGSGYHRECYKAFTGVMKKYLISKPVNSTKNSEKQKSVSVSTYNSSPTTPLIPELTAEPSCLQSLTTESSITSQSSLISNSIESKPTTFHGNRHLQNLPTESSSILQPSLIFDSIKLQSTTSQENIEIFEPDVSDNNDPTEDANILNEMMLVLIIIKWFVCFVTGNIRNYIQKCFHFIKLIPTNLNLVYYPTSKVKKNMRNY
ncbi:mediator of RNA polymerase II transcription subunit 30 [Trichonephila clavata]|uniref:Mediator of RNA polymerase II transcription subunit 30 n=1 Tax=Trichonephila clavata TaxID=2740835 RepID=A0A8X6FB29_TRICU|nr:mediator of RNA polymerase II transcription subunit 30 [Trichonephila clavata]